MTRKARWWIGAGAVGVSLYSALHPSLAAAREVSPLVHVVQSGEVCGQIAERYGVPLSDLAKANGVSDPSRIRAGDKLLIPRVHEVEKGEVLGVLAQRSGLPLETLARINSLHRDAILRPGQRLLIAAAAAPSTATPSRREASSDEASAVDGSAATRRAAKRPSTDVPFSHRVRAGEVLGAIAHQYAVSVPELMKLNGMDSADKIRVGQRLHVPLNDKNRRFVAGGRSTLSGYVRLVGHGKTFQGHVLGPGDTILPSAARGIRDVLASWRTGKKVDLDPRLLRLIVHLSDAFGGRPIRVVSGYRQRSYAAHSKHKTGQALDFSVPGVPNAKVRDYLLKLPDVGVGYYPNSTHVHVDVRTRAAYWVDYSRPGRPPMYRRPGQERARARADGLVPLRATNQS